MAESILRLKHDVYELDSKGEFGDPKSYPPSATFPVAGMLSWTAVIVLIDATPKQEIKRS